MTTPFTIAEFLGVFAAYNAAIWPAQIAAYVFGVVAVAALWLKQPRLILSILALMWLWNAIGYHWLFFSTINPAAPLFAGVFALQAVLLLACAVTKDSVSFRVGRDVRTKAGLAFIAYALIIYPALGLWAGHGFMKGPMFGVAPCPTTIFTIGMLFLARGRWVASLSIVSGPSRNALTAPVLAARNGSVGISTSARRPTSRIPWWTLVTARSR